MAEKTYRVLFTNGASLDIQTEELTIDDVSIHDGRGHQKRVGGVWLNKANVCGVIDLERLPEKTNAPQHFSSVRAR